jgi:uncharacterized protein YwqG
MVFDFFRIKPPPPPPRDVAALLRGLTAPAVRLAQTDDGASYLGGEVALPTGFDWPSKGGKPLALLASLDLDEVHAAYRVDWLPPSGRLLFFYDVDEQPWGFDPKDRGSWAVLFVPDSQSAATGATPGIEPLPRKPIRFARLESVPSYERPGVKALNLSDAESDLVAEFEEQQYEGEPQHHVAGYPSPIQADGMELEAQLASSGIYCGDASGYQDARIAEMQARAPEWRLLLQFDSDDELNVMWGDCGRLYFWVREQDARAGRFENTWVVLQCS